MRLSKLIACLAVASALAGCAGRGPGDGGAGANASNQPAAPSPSAGQVQDLAKLNSDIEGLTAQAARHPDDKAARDTLADAFARRGLVHLEARRLEEALSDYQSALSYNPDHEEAQLRITQINQELNPEPVGDDGRPVTVPARPGASNSNQ
jgi:tetratricopeptide (TPR) repeat protein